jgi:hypothetical protein
MALDGDDAHPEIDMSVTSATDSALVLMGVILAEISPTLRQVLSDKAFTPNL